MTEGPEVTDDGHHIVVDGRKWRATDPDIPEARGAELRSILMAWRREVRATDGSSRARDGVQAAKVALGERGTPWWDQTADERRARWSIQVPRPGEQLGEHGSATP
nr:hypothetical protein [Rhodococcus sp. (in: high G+C Gram-positive bacteria)]